jgi:hypothetical protein
LHAYFLAGDGVIDERFSSRSFPAGAMGLISRKDFSRLGYGDATALTDNLYLLLNREKLAKRLLLETIDASMDAETLATSDPQPPFRDGSNVCKRG